MALIRLAVLLVCCPLAVADDRRAEVNYMLHCQGCHLPDTAGFEGRVPAMRNFVGYFLHSDQGRNFLVRVPGVAQSALDDSELAELMNWLLQAFSRGQLPESFVPYTASEIGLLRKNPLQDPTSTRGAILSEIAKEVPALAEAMSVGRQATD